MNSGLPEKSKALKAYFEALKQLRAEQILTNQKDFTCQIGEWLVEEIYSGKRSKNGIQKGWDVLAGGKYIQVKAHAKANPNRFSAVEKESTVKIDELIIIVFTPDYKLKEFYKAPWEEVLKHIVASGKKKPREEIRWSKLKAYKQSIDKLPKQEIISLFK